MNDADALADSTLDDNFVEHHAGLLATFLARKGREAGDRRLLTGRQRAVLASLGRIIDRALEDE